LSAKKQKTIFTINFDVCLGQEHGNHNTWKQLKSFWGPNTFVWKTPFSNFLSFCKQEFSQQLHFCEELPCHWDRYHCYRTIGKGNSSCNESWDGILHTTFSCLHL